MITQRTATAFRSFWLIFLVLTLSACASYSKKETRSVKQSEPVEQKPATKEQTAAKTEQPIQTKVVEAPAKPVKVAPAKQSTPSKKVGKKANKKTNKPKPKPNVGVVAKKPEKVKKAKIKKTEQPKPQQQTMQAVVKTIEVNLEKLPLRVENQWVIDRSEKGCTLQSVPVIMQDGQGETPVSVHVSKQAVDVVTKSNIDLSYTDTGIRIDNGKPFALETLRGKTNVRLVRQKESLVENMKSGKVMSLAIGFWPTWPVTHARKINVPLEHFGMAFEAWKRCDQLLATKN